MARVSHIHFILVILAAQGLEDHLKVQHLFSLPDINSMKTSQPTRLSCWRGTGKLWHRLCWSHPREATLQTQRTSISIANFYLRMAAVLHEKTDLALDVFTGLGQISIGLGLLTAQGVKVSLKPLAAGAVMPQLLLHCTDLVGRL